MQNGNSSFWSVYVGGLGPEGAGVDVDTPAGMASVDVGITMVGLTGRDTMGDDVAVTDWGATTAPPVGVAPAGGTGFAARAVCEAKI
jgi:hypothetical protein